jgi:hypothetical protein
MKIKITYLPEEERDATASAVAFNDMLNRREVNLYESDNSLSSQ